MTAVAYPSVDMHLWFRMPSLKRKSYSTDSADSSVSDASDLDARPHTPKRWKCEVLETGIAQLSLDPLQHPYTPYQPPQPPLAGPSTGWPADTAPFVGNVPQPSTSWEPTRPPHAHPGAYPIVLPGSVEEPTSPAAGEEPEIPEIKMKGTSWYEPEKDRIVITDLDDDSDVDDTDDLGGISVNSAFINRLKASLNNDHIPREPILPDTSKALVLFRPLVVPDTAEKQQNKRSLKEDYSSVDEVIIEDDYVEPVTDDDAMEIEYL